VRLHRNHSMKLSDIGSSGFKVNARFSIKLPLPYFLPYTLKIDDHTHFTSRLMENILIVEE